MYEEKNKATDGMNDMMRLWFDMVSQAAQSCQSWPANAASPENLRNTRADLFKVWGDAWEHFLRSASFLEANKQSFAGGLEYRKQMHEFLGKLNHELQLATAEDIDRLELFLRRAGDDQREQFDRIGAQLDGMAAKLESLVHRLDAVEAKNP